MYEIFHVNIHLLTDDDHNDIINRNMRAHLFSTINIQTIMTCVSYNITGNFFVHCVKVFNLKLYEHLWNLA